MRIKFFSERLAAPAAALCAAAMMLSLGACGETAASDDAGDKSSDNTTSQIAGVVAKGDLGSKPQISLNSTPMTVKDGAYAILQEGDGDVIEDAAKAVRALSARPVFQNTQLKRSLL